MSYLALARKWRPSDFSQVVGQQHVLSALTNALNNDKLHHAYLFSGTRGVGKTTIGRIFAKGLNCEEGITGSPCGKCQSCQEIDQGRFVDLLEIDAASRTKVEDTRELLDNVQYKPARGRFKVYLIDEVHMLSRHSFNALLKTLEEPPEYVKFLLATTDPQKLPVTILSRCLQFHLKPLSLEDISMQLETVLGHESVEYDNRSIRLLAHAANGSMRDALSLTDQAIALGNGQIDTHNVQSMLGTLDASHALTILRTLLHDTPEQLFEKLEQIASLGVDWDNFLQQLAECLHQIAMQQVVSSVLDNHHPDSVLLATIAQELEPQTIQLYYELVLKGRQSLSLAPAPKLGIEMTLLRMLAFRPQPKQAMPVTLLPQDTVATSVDTVNVRNNALPVIDPAHSAPKQESHGASVAMSPAEMPPKTTVSSTTISSASSAPQNPTPLVSSPAKQPSDLNREAKTNEPTSASKNVVKEDNKEEHSSSTIGSLRHQLRSKRVQLRQQGESTAKKSGNAPSPSAVSSNAMSPSTMSPSTVSPSAVIERMAERTNTSMTKPLQTQPKQEGHQAQEQASYQWQAKQPTITKKEKNELTPAQLKQSLEHDKTPEMRALLHTEAVEKDQWLALINQLALPKMVEQLALNAHCIREQNHFQLMLRPAQEHLNTEKTRHILQQSLQDELKTAVELQVVISDEGETPLELKDTLYQGKLTAAHDALNKDNNVQFLKTRFDATLDSDSVRPLK